MAEEKRKPSSSRRFRVGYALAPKKRRSFIRPSLLSVASSRGIDLVPIDPLLDLQLQGSFDLILHKLPSDPLWRSHLLSFSSSHPDVPVVDPPSAIDRLRNRVSMLQVVSHLTSTPSPSFGVPRQVVAHSRDALAAPLNPSLHFPLIAKPLVSDGSEKSHKMTLVFSRDALLKLKPPVVLQEFVNHGGVIFKVFVAGDHVKCVRRRSLPDVSEDELNWTECSVSFSQISSSKAAAEETPQQQLLEDVEMPPIEFLTDLAAGLRRVLELRLFNFDVIRDVKAGNHYLVVDINYFPGYAKMPSYESFLTDFLCDVLCGDSDERFGGTDGEKNASG